MPPGFKVGVDKKGEIIARKVIEIDAVGTHDSEQIASLAVKKLGLP